MNNFFIFILRVEIEIVTLLPMPILTLYGQFLLVCF